MELTRDEIKLLGDTVSTFIAGYLETLGEGPTLPENLNPTQLRLRFDEPLPYEAQGVERAMQDFFDKVVAGSARVGHPRYMGWIRTSPLAVAVYAEALGAALNQSVAVWDGAPAATEVELRVIEWLKELTGFAPQAGGLLTSGGSMANFVCLLAARQAILPDVRQAGLRGAPPLGLYLTQETHYCVPKAAEMMGLGRDSLRFVPVDDRLRMDPGALQDMLRSDRAAGRLPVAVAATLGSVNTGACDDLVAISRVCREEQVWLHVDGAYGGMANMLPEKAHLAAGLAQANSFTFDPHKSLYIPFEAGLALVRDASLLKATFSMQTNYLPNSAPGGDDFYVSGHASLVQENEPFHFRDFGPQLSRSFRALKIYLTLKAYGAAALAAAQTRQCRLAAQFGMRLQTEPDFELLAPVVLGTVAFRYRPRNSSIEGEELDRLNVEITHRLQQGGEVFITHTRLPVGTALRACFISYRTQEEDIAKIIRSVRSEGERLRVSYEPRGGE